MKIFLKSLIVVLIIILIFSVFKQIQVERYIKNQKEDYKILDNLERINYLPYVIFYFERELSGNRNNREENRAFFMPYELKKIETVTSDKDFDSYIVYCYFSKEEIKKYNETFAK